MSLKSKPLNLENFEECQAIDGLIRVLWYLDLNIEKQFEEFNDHMCGWCLECKSHNHCYCDPWDYGGLDDQSGWETV